MPIGYPLEIYGDTVGERGKKRPPYLAEILERKKQEAPGVLRALQKELAEVNRHIVEVVRTMCEQNESPEDIYNFIKEKIEKLDGFLDHTLYEDKVLDIGFAEGALLSGETMSLFSLRKIKYAEAKKYIISVIQFFSNIKTSVGRRRYEGFSKSLESFLRVWPLFLSVMNERLSERLTALTGVKEALPVEMPETEPKPVVVKSAEKKSDDVEPDKKIGGVHLL